MNEYQESIINLKDISKFQLPYEKSIYQNIQINILEKLINKYEKIEKLVNKDTLTSREERERYKMIKEIINE